MAPPQIDYNSQPVKNFITQLNTVLNSLDQGVDDKTHDKFWQSVKQEDLATVYLTILLGKLVQMDTKALQTAATNISANSNSSSSSSTPVDKAPTDKNDANGNNDDDEYQVVSPREISFNTDELRFDAQEIINEFKLGTHGPNDFDAGLLQKRLDKIADRSCTELVPDNDDFYLFVSNLTPKQRAAILSYDKNWFTTEQLVLRSFLINAIFFITLCFGTYRVKNPSLLNVLDAWLKIRQKLISNTPLEKDVLSEEVREAIISPADATLKLLQLCIDYDTMEESDQVFPPSLNRLDPLTLLPAYAYNRLQFVIQYPRYDRDILTHIVTILKTTSVPSTRFLNLLQFIKIIIPQMYIGNNLDKLEEIMVALKPRLLEPNPIGSTVKEILLYLQKEIRNRGYWMRKRFENCLKRTSAGGVVKETLRTIHILYNGFSTNANALIEKFDINTCAFDDEIYFLKADLVVNMFQYYDEDSAKQLSKEIGVDILSKYYKEMTDLMDKLEGDESELVAKFTQIKERILKDAPNSKMGVLDRVEAMQGRSVPKLGLKLVKLPQEDDLQHCPREKKVYSKSVYLDILQKLEDEARAERPADEKESIIDVALAGGSSTVQRFINNIYAKSKIKPGSNNDIIYRVYLIPTGENNFVSSWLEKYDGWYSRHLHYLVVSPISFVPKLKISPKSSFAKTAKNTVLRKSFVSPVKNYMKKEETLPFEYEAPMDFPTPQSVMRSALNDYFVDAINSIPIYIYNANCLNKEVIPVKATSPQEAGKVIQQKSDRTIDFLSFCFCQRMEIGVMAEALQFQKAEKLDNQTLDELIANSKFKYEGLRLTMSYVPMDQSGELVRATEIAEKEKTYTSISIVSSSYLGDKGQFVGPNQPWLEVVAEDFVATDLKAQTVKKRKKVKETEGAAPSTNVIKYHVGSITIESATADKFSVMMDGEVFGPYHKIVINQATQSVALQTFSQIHIY